MANMTQVKPNLGHSEGASGTTSLMKAVLALENKIIPPNINFSEPNPKSTPLSDESQGGRIANYRCSSMGAVTSTTRAKTMA